MTLGSNVTSPGVCTWKGWQPKPPSDPALYEKLLKRIRVLCQARGDFCRGWVLQPHLRSKHDGMWYPLVMTNIAMV